MSKKSLTRSALSAYLCICVALLLLLALSIWGAYRDARYLRMSLLHAEVVRLRSYAERTVGRLERDVEQQGNSLDLSGNVRDTWLGSYWSKVLPHDEEHLYAALVDQKGTVLMHSDPQLAGRRLERRWFYRTVPEAGENVVETQSVVLSGGEPAYDIRVPITVDDQEVGEYHIGFQIKWFDTWAAAKRNTFLRQRALTVGGILLVVLLATTSLFYIAAHAVALRRAISRSQLDRATEVAQLAAGLAHEIRNPMHAIRLNLHALATVDDQRRLKLSPEEHAKLLEESNRELARVEKLMQELVNFASPDRPRDELIDVNSEVQSTIDFIRQEFLRREIKVSTQFPPHHLKVRFDPGRLRQLLLNLLQNAEQALEGRPGRIDVDIRQTADHIWIEVADNGPGVPEADRERIFEPFYSTKRDGSGLGLALVQRFVREANGSVCCDARPQHGTIFRVKLPRPSRTEKGKSS